MKELSKLFWITAILTLIVCSTCVRIEILNFKADCYLPVKWPDGYQGRTKWRYFCPNRAMHTEREYRIYRSDHNLAEDAILPTDAIQKISAEVDVTMERGRAENKLHNVAQGFWGFLQYILVPLSFLCAIRLATRKGNRTNRIAGIVFIIAIAACGVLMIYRNYLTGFAD